MHYEQRWLTTKKSAWANFVLQKLLLNQWVVAQI